MYKSEDLSLVPQGMYNKMNMIKFPFILALADTVRKLQEPIQTMNDLQAQ